MSVGFIRGAELTPVNGSRIIRGAIVDITQLKMAEGAVRELSHIAHKRTGKRTRPPRPPSCMTTTAKA
jgi:hypothetical protein